MDKPKPVTRKISSVPDSTCVGCAFNWEGECNAYSMPHSRAEQEKREGQEPKCLPDRHTQARPWEDILNPPADSQDDMEDFFDDE